MTLISRILGFCRDMLIARIFGVDASTDAFFIAFKLPDFLRRLFTDGAFAQAFMPVLADYKAQNTPTALRQLLGKMFGTLAVISLLMTVIGIIIAPLIILLFAPGFFWQSSQAGLTLAIQMLQIMLPYLLFITLIACAGSVLNLHHKFAVVAITPLFLNLCMISAAIWLAPKLSEPLLALAWAVVAAGVVQLLFQLPALKNLQLLPPLKIDFTDNNVKKVIKLMLPVVLASSLVQINLLLNNLLASFLVPGSVSWLYYADRLVEFPLGILGIAVATVILPTLSKSFASQNSAAFSSALDWGLRLVLLIGIPAAIGLFLLAEPLLSILFQSDKFAAIDVEMTGKSLMAYAAGLVGFILVKILVPGFTARNDVKTPMRFSLYAILVNIGLSSVLIFPLAHTGLALATSLGVSVNAVCLLWRLLKSKIYQPNAGWSVFLSRVLLANAIMAAGIYSVVDELFSHQYSNPEKVLHLAILIMGALLVYSLSLLLLGFNPKQLLVVDKKAS
jgi:putative peptidoglycan lipid II flippase